jgi:hypothetical protein
MIIVVVGLIAIGVFYFVRQRGRQFLREVAHTTKLYLQTDNEPERAITDYIRSAEFKRSISAEIGVPIATLRGAARDQLVFQASIKATKLYHSRADYWRRNWRWNLGPLSAPQFPKFSLERLQKLRSKPARLKSTDRIAMAA